jgi:hypothetical protein
MERDDAPPLVAGERRFPWFFEAASERTAV